MRRAQLLILTSICFLGSNAMALTLTSPAFKNGESIPKIYTCDGSDISPALSWSDVPAGTKSLALIVDDPDAPRGVWDHWILFNIPPTVSSLADSIKTLPAGTQRGKNSAGKNEYHGPCPPNGEHHYFFKLYALDTKLNLNTGATKSALETAMQGHILAQTELMGRYKR